MRYDVLTDREYEIEFAGLHKVEVGYAIYYLINLKRDKIKNPTELFNLIVTNAKLHPLMIFLMFNKVGLKAPVTYKASSDGLTMFLPVLAQMDIKNPDYEKYVDKLKRSRNSKLVDIYKYFDKL